MVVKNYEHLTNTPSMALVTLLAKASPPAVTPYLSHRNFKISNKYSIMYKPTHIACRGLLRRCDIRRRA